MRLACTALNPLKLFDSPPTKKTKLENIFKLYFLLIRLKFCCPPPPQTNPEIFFLKNTKFQNPRTNLLGENYVTQKE